MQIFKDIINQRNLLRHKGPTRGSSSFVTEYNPKNGRVRSWQENYTHNGKINRVRLQDIDGQKVKSFHNPMTGYEQSLLLTN
ncbi:MAG: hypothetical protein AB8B66_05415 [Rickettsiaceae bacterium]